MISILRLLLARIIHRGNLEMDGSSGTKFSVGEGSRQAIAMQLNDRAAEWQLVLDPMLALREVGALGDNALLKRGEPYSLRSSAGPTLSMRRIGREIEDPRGKRKQ